MIKNLSWKSKIVIGLISVILIAVFCAAIFCGYVYYSLLPKMIKSNEFNSQLNKYLTKSLGVHYVIKNPVLITNKFEVDFNVDEFCLIKNNKKILLLSDFRSEFSLARILAKKIIVKKLGAEYIFVDVNSVLELFSAQQKEQKPSAWNIDLFKSILYISNLKVLYSIDNELFFDITGKNIKIYDTDELKKIKFDILALMSKNNKNVRFSIKDDDKIFIKKNKLYVDNCQIYANNSKINVNGWIKENLKYNLDFTSKKFPMENIVDLVRYNIVIPNGSELLSCFKNIKGNFDFKFNMTEKNYSGNMKLNKLGLLFIPIKDVPVNLHSGEVVLDEKDIELKNFKGYYGTRKINDLKFGGTIKDYMKTFDTKITADAVVTNDFAKYYLSEVIGYPVGISGKADTRLIINSLKGDTDMIWLFKLEPDSRLLVGGEPLDDYPVKKVLFTKMKLYGTTLDINEMSYIVSIVKDNIAQRIKMFSLNGKIDFSKGIDFREMGVVVDKPVPSEFLNVLIRKEIFKQGTMIGSLKAVQGPKGVKLFGNFDLNKIRIPSQRLYLKSAKVNTNFDNIFVKSNGRYRRSNFDLDMNFVNNIAFPVVVNDLKFTLGSLDIDRLLHSFNQQGQNHTQGIDNNVSDNDDIQTFDLSNLIIKNSTFNLDKGQYKEIEFGNLHANMTLDENNVLRLKSNKFDFADGNTSADINCDFRNHKYSVKLGIRDVDADAIAVSLLNLKKEISGKASGWINLNTDESLKLNGIIKFIIKNGQIGKVGLIEYILKVASVFRNPIVMISPATIFDLFNIPDGSFNDIKGSLGIKNNVIEKISIKSNAPQLSAYIAGKYDIERSDASIRVYTKLSNKGKGVFGVLRNISLGSIASRVSSANRYSVNYFENEVNEIPKIEGEDKSAQIFVTKIEGDVEHNNFLSSLTRIK